MSKSRRYAGLKFVYKLEGSDSELSDKYESIEELLHTEFPKNGNPLSPTLDTHIYGIRWNRNLARINKNVTTLKDLIDILNGEYYISNSDIRLTEYGFSEQKLERKSIYSIEEIREITKDVLFKKRKNDSKVELDGDIIKGNSERYQTFFTKGCKCAKCGIEGKYFAKEKHLNDKVYHLNLYAINEEGEEVLMTKDHIFPKSKGGKNDVSNYQTMCSKCNMDKGNSIIN